MASSLPSSPWILFGLLVFSVAVTLVTSWLVRHWRGSPAPGLTAPTVLAGLLWVAVVFAAGLVAARYAERMKIPVMGYLLFGALACALSLVRAVLYVRASSQGRARPEATWNQAAGRIAHTLRYLLWSAVCFLALSWLAQRYAEPILFIPLAFGALLPDLDTPDSLLGRLLPFLSRRLSARAGHLQEWHSLGAAALVGAVTAPLILVVGTPSWAAIVFGFVLHLALDLLGPGGVMLAWPLSRKRYSIPGRLGAAGTEASDRRLTLVLAAGTLFLLLAVDLGQPPPAPTPAPPYEEILEQYYSLRGRNQVVAAVEGTWQATGRRIRDRFEILNGVGDSLIMLDRFTGKVFSAGRGAGDNLYLNSIRLEPGSPVKVQAVEVQLNDQTLAAALPAIYEMEREPGLQHIYVSGDLVLPPAREEDGPPLPLSYAQTSLRQIQAKDPADGSNRYSLQYLGASEFIELASVEAQIADLVIVATYTDPAAGPTPTALPTARPPATATRVTP
jgi:membrane-bound metal-dependent hydrolase YbcI (DUF457 family)